MPARSLSRKPAASEGQDWALADGAALRSRPWCDCCALDAGVPVLWLMFRPSFILSISSFLLFFKNNLFLFLQLTDFREEEREKNISNDRDLLISCLPHVPLTPGMCP